ncbi:MAG: phage tail length tape measure family protein, partial [Janthinobacterium lividum]
KASKLTVSGARDIEAAYVQTGKIGLTILPGLTAATQDFAAATGTDVATATAALGQAFADPVKGAQDLTERYGYLDQAQIAQIKRMAEAGDALGAQKVLLDALAAATAHASDNVSFFSRVWTNFKNTNVGIVDFVGAGIDHLINGLPALQKLSDLQTKLAAARANYSGGLGQDANLASLQAEVVAQTKIVAAEQAKAAAVQNTANANANAAKASAIVAGSAYGDAGKTDLQTKLGAVNKVLADGGQAAKLSATQLAEYRQEQDALTRAVATYIPEADKARQVLALDAQIAAAKTPAEKAALAAQKERVEQSGKVVTSADAEANAQAKAAAALATASKSGEGHAATLAREAAAMGVAAKASLDLANAYLSGGSAAIEAEARRKAATDATKKGIDVEDQVRRQLALNVAEGAAAGAKSVDALRDENDARTKVNALVASGSINVAAANDNLRDEAVLRPLLKLQAVAQGDALESLTRVIAAYRAALADAHAEEKRSQVDSIVEGAKNTVAGLRDQIEFAGDRSGRGALEEARRAAQRAAATANDNPDDANRRVAAGVDVVQATLDQNRAKYLADARNSQVDALTLSQAELATLGKSDDARAAILDHVREELRLRAQGIPFDSAAAQADLAQVDALAKINAALGRSTAAMNELHSAGSQVVDDVLNPSNWSSWGSLGKSVLHDIENELIKLAAINPIKNWLNGSSLPTLSSLGGLFGGGDPISGGIGSLVSSNSAISIAAPALHFAAGSEYTPGGRAWVDENGPEEIDLPTGSRVLPASAVRAMQAQNDNRRGDVHQHFYLDGAIVDQSLYQQMQTIGVNAAAGGSAMAQDDLARKQRRTMR